MSLMIIDPGGDPAKTAADRAWPPEHAPTVSRVIFAMNPEKGIIDAALRCFAGCIFKRADGEFELFLQTFACLHHIGNDCAQVHSDQVPLQGK